MGENVSTENERRLILPVDTNLHRRYTVGRFLASDGCATIYAGFDYKARQNVRIVEYYPERLSVRTYDSPAVSPKSKGCGQLFFLGSEAFLSQYSALTGAIGSPNLLSIFDAFFENGTAYAVTEELDGLSLREYLSVQRRNLTGGELSAILRQLSDGLLVLHSLGILHHDISPDAIWLCIDGTVKLARFGAARRVLSTRRELSEGEPALDIRSLGQTLFYAYTGFTSLGELPDGGGSMPPILLGIFERMLSDAPSMCFSGIFDLRHAVSQMDIPPARLPVTVDMVDGYRTALQRERAEATRPAPAQRTEPDTRDPEPAVEAQAAKKGRLHQNWKILIAYGLMIAGALLIALLLKNLL